MTDTLEKRISDLEQMLAHVPEDLGARFAGVDTKLAQIREVQALHNTRFTKLETQLAGVATQLAGVARDVREAHRKLDEILLRLSPPGA